MLYTYFRELSRLLADPSSIATIWLAVRELTAAGGVHRSRRLASSRRMLAISANATIEIGTALRLRIAGHADVGGRH